jgi:3,4-dihydroxy 2-butanone 4-phosphate synthase/GTP cyclohydrolase II
MARRDDLGLFAEKHGIKWGTIEDLISYRVENEKTIERIDERPFNTPMLAPNLQGVLSHNRLRCVLDESTHHQVVPLVGKYALVVQCQ